MDLIKWEPFGELLSLRQQMDRLFESFTAQEPVSISESRWAPSIDVAETNEEILVKAELPGIDKKDVSAMLSGDNLIIKGERQSEKEEKDKHFHRVERSYGAFNRVIPLPVSVDQDKIKCDFSKGVLEVHLPKKPGAKPKEISINVN